MDISEHGKSFIKKVEGVRLKAYLCSGGVWTIGYGSTTYIDGRKVMQGDVITKEQANELFEQTVNIRVKYINEYIVNKINCNITQSCFDALVSFVFNVGLGAFLKGSVHKYMLLCNVNKAGEFLLKYNKVYSNKEKKLVISKGLDLRRKQEYKMLLNGKDKNVIITKDEKMNITKDIVMSIKLKPIELLSKKDAPFYTMRETISISDNTNVSLEDLTQKIENQ